MINMVKMPDELVGSLIQHKETEEIKRVIRDDGENGLHISPPEHPSEMRPISRDAFRSDWVLYKTVGQQLREEGDQSAKEEPFRGEHARLGTVVRGLSLESQTQMPSVDSRHGVDEMTREDRQKFGALSADPFEGRAEPTPRGEEADELVATKAADVTFSGQPVGGNEEPAELFEEDRADDGAAEEEAPLPKTRSTKKSK